MKAYSIDLREKIVAAHINKKISIRKVADIFSVSKSFVQKLLLQQKTDGNLERRRTRKATVSYILNAEVELTEIVEANSDATLLELCELFADKTGNWVSQSTMSNALKRFGLTRKKKQKEVVKHLQIEFKS